MNDPSVLLSQVFVWVFFVVRVWEKKFFPGGGGGKAKANLGTKRFVRGKTLFFPNNVTGIGKTCPTSGKGNFIPNRCASLYILNIFLILTVIYLRQFAGPSRVRDAPAGPLQGQASPPG